MAVALFSWILQAAHGSRAAWTGGLLLVAGLAALVQFHRTGKLGALALGWFCFGLGMWDRALFAWTLGGWRWQVASFFIGNFGNG